MLLVALAAAHVPHAVVSGIAAPRADTSLAWYLALNCEVPTGLYRSYDLGATWEAFAADPMQDEITDGGYTDDGYAVLLGARRVWVTADGATWTASPLRRAPVGSLSPMAGGDQVYFAAADGVYAYVPGGLTSVDLATEGMQSVHEGEDGVVAIGDSGNVYWRNSGTWEDLGAPSAEQVWSGTSGDGDVYAGTESGAVYRWTGSAWAACDTVPLGAEGDTHGMITRLDYRDGKLLVARADVGPAVSTDACLSWTDIRSPLDNEFEDGGASAYTTDERAFVMLVSDGDTLVTAGFDGVGSSVDGGATWHFSYTLGPDFAQAGVFSKDVTNDGVVFLANYGSALARVTDWGAEVATAADGILEPNGEDLYIEPTATSTFPMYGVFNRQPYTSADGSSWAALAGISDTVRQLDPGQGGAIYAAGVTSSTTIPGSILYSEDATTWSRLASIPSELKREVVNHALDLPGYLCLQSTERVYCSTDGGGIWTLIHEVTESTDRVRTVAPWPKDAPTVILLSDDSGVYRWDGGGLLQVHDTADGPEVLYIETTDNDLVYALDVVGTLWTSTDAGLTWAEVGVQVPMQSAFLTSRPDFATYPELLVGGLDGTYLIRGTSIERFAPYQRVDDSGQFHRCTGCEADRLKGGVLGTGATLDAGDTFTVNIRGSQLRLSGASSTGAIVTVTLDGVSLGDVTIPMKSGSETLWETSGLDDTWHRFEMSVGVGELVFDGMEGWGDGGAELDNPTSDPGTDTPGTDDSGGAETGETGDTSGGETDTSEDTDTGGDTEPHSGETNETDPHTGETSETDTHTGDTDPHTGDTDPHTGDTDTEDTDTDESDAEESGPDDTEHTGEVPPPKDGCGGCQAPAPSAAGAWLLVLAFLRRK